MRIEHPIPPLWSADSQTLILGSFPSVKSREAGFFYGHPQNRFWRSAPLSFLMLFPKRLKKKSSLSLHTAWRFGM